MTAPAVLARVAARLGRDPMPELTALGQVRANPHFGPAADPAMAARAIEEELTRHAALTGRADEIRDAAAEIAEELDERITWSACAPPPRPSTPPTRDRSRTIAADEHAEHLEFEREVRVPEASKSRRPRKR